MKTQSLKWFTVLLTMAAGALMAQSTGTAPRTAAPGTVNYIEGTVSLDGAPLTGNQIGKITLQTNQTLSTTKGKAEVLLSPGALLRLGDNTEIRMVAPELVNPQVEVLQGSALVEVGRELKDTTLTILERGAAVSILKQGLYRFDAGQDRIAVIDGKVRVTADGTSKTIGRGKAITLSGEPTLTVEKFDRKAKDDLYLWSQVRSESLADANVSMARIYSGYGPYTSGGWFWNPSFGMYSWLPGSGYAYSPFGYQFYSLGYAAPFYSGFYGGGFSGPGMLRNRPYVGRGFSGTRRQSSPGPRQGGGFTHQGGDSNHQGGGFTHGGNGNGGHQGGRGR
ncbi:MAG: hypothetical protein JWN34_522 [Bryobacterales bacterium]|nr:hypothetical protein [Bryobacterales bacterium]